MRRERDSMRRPDRRQPSTEFGSHVGDLATRRGARDTLCYHGVTDPYYLRSYEGLTMAWTTSPFNRLLGVNVLHHSAERTEAELIVREELLNRRGVMHGGAVMALGDTLGGMTASISLPEGGRT